MAKTELRNDAKNQIIKILRQQGYPTYARLVDYFDIFLTDDPNVIGYMVPNKAKIVLNQNLNINQVSTIVRHEVLHEYLTHAIRADKINKSRGGNHELANIAADFEISNKGYTKSDKAIARKIKLGDKILTALVTEDQRPGWEYMSFEEMYNKLLDEQDQQNEQLKDLIDLLNNISGKTMEDMEDSLEDNSGKGSSDTQGDDKQDSSESDDSDSSSDSTSGGSDLSDKQKNELGKALDKLQDKLDDIEDKKDSSGEPLDTPSDQRDKAAVAKQVKAIRELLQDKGLLQSARDEAAAAVRKENAAKAAQDIDRINSSGIQQFKLNLNRFIGDQIGEFEDDSYSRINPSYEDTEFIMPGKMYREEKNVPNINVYWDVSGSFSDEAKTASARQAIATLNQYVRDGDIEIDVFYFADYVSDSRDRAGGGTRGTPIQDHIDATKPTNVIIVTDGDISDCRRVTEVPGAVWMLFYGSRSENVMDHIRGKRQNKYYDITWGGR